MIEHVHMVNDRHYIIHVLTYCIENHLDFIQFIDDYYRVQSYISVNRMSFHPLPN
jgi:hypothetical protein